MQDFSATLYRESGLDIAALADHAAQQRPITKFAAAESIERDSFWGLDCDILLPAALEGQIHAGNTHRIKEKLVVEGANGPTDPVADNILHGKGTLVVPDVLANAGGVTVRYFEWVQDFSSFFWSEDEINQRLVRVMLEAFRAVWQVAQQNCINLRTAAFVVACTRILQARELRGPYP